MPGSRHAHLSTTERHIMSVFSGPTPRIIGATIYALNRTHGLAPAQGYGPPETVTEVLDGYSGLVKTAEGNVYANGSFGITKFASPCCDGWQNVAQSEPDPRIESILNPPDPWDPDEMHG
jgi:hypothetical protein